MDFSKFDKLVDQKKLKEDLEQAQQQSLEFDEVPKGTYIISFQDMAVKPTKAGDKLMFAAQAKIIETINSDKKQDGRWIFFNRVIFGNKVSERWNDGYAIDNVLGWFRKFELNPILEFESYVQFAADVEEAFTSEIQDKLEFKVEYDADAFNPIKILEVYDV